MSHVETSGNLAIRKSSVGCYCCSRRYKRYNAIGYFFQTLLPQARVRACLKDDLSRC